MVIFLSVDDILILYKACMDRFGGFQGIRDLNLLESAVAQVRMLYYYQEVNVFELASDE